ncbi:MAG: NAD(P)H-binding protein [Acaryochloridaceae cyanobacterium RU_4_10]|nr:NAD(P)H-binding protein [Acaryochloridaceae cyanobacterium RU_4_10]
MAHNTETNLTANQTILVLGGSGKTGRRIVERLQERHIPVRIGSRTAEPPFNWEDASTWGDALEGVTSVYISFFPDIAVPGAPETIAAFTAQALDLGIRRLVLLSGRGEEEAQRAEQMLQNSGADWTIVRCSWFMQNFSESLFLEPILAGEVALPVGDIPEPFVDAEDIADVAVAALTEDGHVGQLYELTGPRMLTFEQAIAEIGQASGRDLRFKSVSVEAFAQEMTEQGNPADIVDFLGYLFGEVLDGRNAHLSDGVERALDRKPRDFAEFTRWTASTGIWGGSRV